MAMRDIDQKKLRSNRIAILKDVKFEEIKDHLISCGTLSDIDVEEIDSEKTPRKRMSALLDLLPKRGSQAYSQFGDAVKDQYPWIVEQLNSTVESTPVEERQRVREPFKDLNHAVLAMVTKSDAVQDFKTIVRFLELTEADIFHEEHACSGNISEQFYQCLLKWKNKKGKLATVESLIEALRDSEYSNIADKLDGYVE